MLKSSNSFSMPPLKKGDRIKGGQYEIIDNTVNEGGFGRIYRAYGSRRINDDVALLIICLGAVLLLAFLAFDYIRSFISLLSNWTA